MSKKISDMVQEPEDQNQEATLSKIGKEKRQLEKEIDDIRQHFPKHVFFVKCRKVDSDQVICYLDYDGSEVAKQVYTKLFSQNLTVSIDNPIVTLNRKQFGEMLIGVSKTDGADKSNTGVMLKILNKFDESQPDNEFSFGIIISNYYKQIGNAMQPANLVELVFNDSTQLSTMDEPKTDTTEKRQLSQEELIILQEQAQGIRQEIKKLQLEKTKLENANSKLNNVNSTIESNDEVIRMINEIQTELKQIKIEKDDLIMKTFALNDEILELKKLLLKVKYDVRL